MQIAHPQALTWLLALIPCAAALVAYFIWKRRLTRSLGHAPMIAAMSSEVSRVRQVSSGVLSLLGLGLLIVALIQPQWGQSDQLVKRSGIDVVFALDLSRSMLARDVVPSRLDAAKKEISTTLEQLAGDRAGLVVFTSVSFAQSPLTSDYGALRFYLRKLKPGQMPFGGTSIGRAIFDGVDLLSGDAREEDGVPRMKRSKNQIIVLITDGEDHESDPMAAARQAREANIHIVTVGLGSAKGERIPTYNQDGTISGYQRNRKGDVVLSKLDDSTLRKVAAETGGRYIHYQGENSVAYELVDYINALEKSELEAMMKQRYKERFYLFLAPGLLLILIGFLLGDRRRPGARRVGSGGQGDVATRYLLTASASLVLLFGMGCEEVLMQKVEEVERANDLIKQGKGAEALALYEEASTKELLDSPPELSFNMGRAQMEIEGSEAMAQEAFARALETDDPHLRFDALYNLGLVLARQQKWKDAYETFQQALLSYAEHPEWIAEQEAKYQDAITNMEVAWQKLFPPCETLEDDMEDNDSVQTATKLEAMKVESRTLCGGDDDYYRIPLVAGARVSVTATFEDLREVLDPELPFLGRAEDLQISLFTTSGARVLAVDQGVRSDGETAKVSTFASPNGERHKTRRELVDLIVTQDMLGDGAQEILLKVKAEDEREFSYDFEVEVIPPCIALEDAYEPNDSRQEAQLATINMPMSGHLCPGNEDWFTIDVAQGDTLFVDLQTQPDIELERPPELNFEILDERGERVLVGESDGGFMTAALWAAPTPRRYFLRVLDASQPLPDAPSAREDVPEQGPYQLSLYRYGPCPEGDDRLEDNDDVQSEATLSQEAPQHRYLRICDNDEDFFQVKLPEPQSDDARKDDDAMLRPGAPQQAPDEKRELEVSLAPLFSPTQLETFRGGDYPLEEVAQEGQEEKPTLRTPSLALVDPSRGGTIVLDAAPVATVTRQGATPSDDVTEEQDKEPVSEEMNLLVSRRILDTELAMEQATVRVRGPEMFYHIELVNPSSGQQDQQEQDDQQNEGEDQQDGSGEQDDQKKEGEQSDDGEPQDESGEGEQDDKGEEQKEEEESGGDDSEDGEKQDEPQEKEGEDGKPKPSEDASGEESEQPPANPLQEQENARVERVEDILRALEESDDNFQMRKALENAPGRYIEKDW